jgi:DNA invertase Pin-like site-specific DNA recombinase
MARAIDWTRYEQLKAQGHSEREIARALEIPRTTLPRALQRRERPPSTTPRVTVHGRPSLVHPPR